MSLVLTSKYLKKEQKAVAKKKDILNNKYYPFRYQNYFNRPDSLLQGGINGALSAGCFVGALFAGYPADRFSRKLTLIFASCLFVVGSVFQAASNGVALLCVGRVLNGLSVGITSMVVPLYQSEIAPKEIRGRIVSVQQWAITWGIFIA